MVEAVAGGAGELGRGPLGGAVPQDSVDAANTGSRVVGANACNMRGAEAVGEIMGSEGWNMFTRYLQHGYAVHCNSAWAKTKQKLKCTVAPADRISVVRVCALCSALTTSLWLCCSHNWRVFCSKEVMCDCAYGRQFIKRLSGRSNRSSK